MWLYVVKLILRYRLAMIILIASITCFMGYHASKVKLSYDLARMLPDDNKHYVDYQEFRKRFGEDGNVLVVGVNNPNLFKLEEFKAFTQLCNDLRKYDGVEEVVSITRALNIVKNDSLHRFDFKPIISTVPSTQSAVDSIKLTIESLKFYDGFIFNKKNNSYLIAITLNKLKLNDKSRVALVLNIKDKVDAYTQQHNLEPHYSGLPYIRTQTTEKVKSELQLFVILSLLIAAFIMALFFRSGKVIFASLIIVAVSVTWALGITSLLGYKITILSGVIPSLITIIAIENCIYLLNKYHWEFRSHGNKILALCSVVRRIGFATLMTNATTATGFATFIFTNNNMLKEFGVVSSMNVMLEFLLCLILIPIIFSYLPAPEEKHIKHLENKSISKILDKILNIILNKRKWVYSILGVFLALCVYGISIIGTSGKVVDDLPEKDPIYKDLKYFEKNYGGVMPFEISIDTKKPNGIMKFSNLRKMSALQDTLEAYNKMVIEKGIYKDPVFSKPLSMVEVLKFCKQSFYNGDPEFYEMPNNNDRGFILSYIPKGFDKTKGNMLRAFKDSTNRYTRISVQMADLGSKQMNDVLAYLKPRVDSIFDTTCNVTITGNSVVYTKGTEYLIGNLVESVLLGIVLICLLMALVFSSARMIFIAMVCNIIPLLITAAIMGYFNIPIKPSTLIVFSVALGISIDNAILFLTKYRHELKIHRFDIKKSVIGAVRETGISMIYTSLVLVLGFGIFMISDFGGTKALGFLISLTLFIALFFNIIVLPSMLISLDKMQEAKAMKDPLLEIYDEEEDIEIEELQIQRNIPIEKFKQIKS